MRALATVLLAALTIPAFGCSAEVEVEPDGTPPRADRPAEGAPDTTALSMRSLYHDTSSDIEDARRLVIRSEAEWRDFWREAHANRASPEPAPSVDFDRSMVVAATMGRRSSGGHAIDVESVVAIDGRTVVEVVEISPGEGCLTTQALTAPAVAVAVDRRSGETAWEVRRERSAC